MANFPHYQTLFSNETAAWLHSKTGNSAKKTSKSSVGEEGEVDKDATPLFFAIFANLHILPADHLALFPNETAATKDNSQTRLKSAFQKRQKSPFQQPPRSKIEFRNLQVRFDPPIFIFSRHGIFYAQFSAGFVLSYRSFPLGVGFAPSFWRRFRLILLLNCRSLLIRTKSTFGGNWLRGPFNKSPLRKWVPNY